MIIIGHNYIEYRCFYKIKTIEDIKKTPSSSTVLLVFNKENVEILKYCEKNSISFGVFVNSIKEVVFANALNASFIIVDKKFALQTQKIADEYLFDSKILVLGNEESDIEFVALNFIDGIIFKDAIREY